MTGTGLRWTLFALVVTALPFVGDVPNWIPPIIALTVIWRYAAFVRKWPLPPAVLRMAWAVGSFFVIYYHYGTINGLEPGSALLLLMSAMKLTEATRARDLVVVVYMAFFNVVTHALFDQQILSSLYGVAALAVVVAALLQVTRRTEPVKPKRALARSANLLAQALPLTILLFLLFPRVPGPLWALPTSSKGTTGLSDSMEIGRFSELLESGATAFRARFDGALPPPAQRYWRGPVFDRIIGNVWSAAPEKPSREYNIDLLEPSYDYDLTLEASQRNWIFALDVPATPDSLPANTRLNEHLQLLADEPIKERTQYRLRAYPSYRLDAAGAALDRSRYLDVSMSENPRTERWARELRTRYTDDAELLRAVLERFSEAPFAYTLAPASLGDGSASDAFLFESREGFCEHYASSFALLMRYAGIPARIVTGYQGGERNPIGRHLTVRQSDAHAWTEVWLSERGWVRIDPTAAVSPDRVERGIQDALGAGEALPPVMLRNGPILSRLRLGWDAANAAWNRHVLSYGKASQQRLLRKLGFKTPSASTLILLLTASSGIVLGILAIALAARRRRARDPVLRAWHRVTHQLAKIGLPRARHETANRYAARVADERPDLAQELIRLASQFSRLRYSESASDKAELAWLRAAARFKPRAASRAYR
ncbi:MAG: DUF3488 and transglutaminase-like domain-containing protein [Pseudomonadota bacterium]